MLNELGHYLTQSKATDLLKRIEHENPDQALPGEYELALAWAVSKVAHLEIDRPFGSRTPDIYSRDLLRAAPLVAEVAAMSDDPLSGETLMRRAANIINGIARQVRKDASEHLHYEFLEESEYLPPNRHSQGRTRYVRRRCVTRKFKMDAAFESALRGWLRESDSLPPFRWKNQEIDVVITWRDWVHWMGNTFSRMPAVTYDSRENPLYELLKTKAKQLRGVPEGTLKAIFLGEAGCSLLRDIRPSYGRQEVNGDEIIRRFMSNNDVDLVAVFVPKRSNELAMWNHNNPRLWHLYAYARSLSEADMEPLKRIRDILPAPYLHGYQARSWHQQRMFDPQSRGHYLPLQWTGGLGKMTIRMSARALQEYLAGRLSNKQLSDFVMGDHNPFEAYLARGKVISAARFEPKSPDSDDDYLVFEFEEDASASPLKLPDQQ
jgi:hypothetical protein